jgi:GDPmannose 4,6-dehydratase
VIGRVRLISIAPSDFRSVLTTLAAVRPDEVYNLSGQSSVGLSFEQPVETMESISIATLNLLEAIRFLKVPIRFYNASSGECFGDTNGIAATEEFPFRPRSPYAVAKAAAHFEVANYREAYNLYACNGILFNHESQFRPERFVTRKVIAAACRIAAGNKEKLSLGNVQIIRDWGWAPEYVDAMWRILQQPKASDYVVATGQSHSLENFVASAFAMVGLDWTEHVELDESLLRPSDIAKSYACPEKASRTLGWKARIGMQEVIWQMIEAEQMRQRQGDREQRQ